MSEQWTLPELVSEVAARIAALPPPKNGQVRAVPDERTVRYYGTIGLLDRPLAMRGRTALYGRRHLAQVVAIKRLQHAEKSLADIQALWPTLDDATLARMSGITLPGAAKRRGRPGFWKDAPSTEQVAAKVEEAKAVAREFGDLDEDELAVEAYRERERDRRRRPRSRMEEEGEREDEGGLEAEGLPFASPFAMPPGAMMSGGMVPGGMPPGAAPLDMQVPAVELRVELAPKVVLSLSMSDESVAISPADVRAIRAAAAPLIAELAKRGLTPQPGGD